MASHRFSRQVLDDRLPVSPPRTESSSFQDGWDSMAAAQGTRNLCAATAGARTEPQSLSPSVLYNEWFERMQSQDWPALIEKAYGTEKPRGKNMHGALRRGFLLRGMRKSTDLSRQPPFASKRRLWRRKILRQTMHASFFFFFFSLRISLMSYGHEF